MPGRKRKPARLWLRPGRPEKFQAAKWVIIDDRQQISTGCDESEINAAEKKLEEYRAAKHITTAGGRDLSTVKIADVLLLYAESKEPIEFKAYKSDKRKHLSPELKRKLENYDFLLWRIQTLNEWWGEKTMLDIVGKNCRSYVEWRTSQGLKRAIKEGSEASRRKVSVSTARRELEDLSAAVGHYKGEFVLAAVPVVTLPEKAARRDEWMTRNQVARLLGAALGFVWNDEEGCWAYRMEGNRRCLIRRDKMTRTRRRHIARFILTYLYTGTRHEAILRLQWMPNTAGGWWDIERERLYRRGMDERETNKRRPPARIPDQIMPHLRRWQRIDPCPLKPYRDEATLWFIHRPDGKPLADRLRSSWEGCLADAGLPAKYVPHILKHTGLTWAMQNGTDIGDVAQLFAVSLKVLYEVYWHHHPDYQEGAARAFSRKEK